MRVNGVALLAALLAFASLLLPVGLDKGAPVHWQGLGTPIVAVGLSLLAAAATLPRRGNNLTMGIVGLVGALIGASAPLAALDAGLTIGPDGAGFWLLVAAAASRQSPTATTGVPSACQWTGAPLSRPTGSNSEANAKRAARSAMPFILTVALPCGGA